MSVYRHLRDYIKKKDPAKSRAFLFLVPRARLELAWIAPHAPQACVYTNFTTSAKYLSVTYLLYPLIFQPSFQRQASFQRQTLTSFSADSASFFRLTLPYSSFAPSSDLLVFLFRLGLSETESSFSSDLCSVAPLEAVFDLKYSPSFGVCISSGPGDASGFRSGTCAQNRSVTGDCGQREHQSRKHKHACGANCHFRQVPKPYLAGLAEVLKLRL